MHQEYLHLNKVNTGIPRCPTDAHSELTCFFLPYRYNHWRPRKRKWNLWRSESPKKWAVRLTWLAAFETVIANYAHTSVTYLHEDFDGSNKCDVCHQHNVYLRPRKEALHTSRGGIIPLLLTANVSGPRNPAQTTSCSRRNEAYKYLV